MNAPAVPRPPGGTTKGNALTGRQIELLIAATHVALKAADIEVGPSRVARIVHRFKNALARSAMTFHEFLTDETSQRRLKLRDPELARVIAYMDETGETAARNVDRERGW